jgi:predicted nucleotide-binding protein
VVKDIKRRPRLFVGSSSEGIAFARAVRAYLEQDVEPTVWDEGTFQLGQTSVESLSAGLSRFDFAVLVLTPDDAIQSRSEDFLGPRDNVIFELGLFMGRLGRDRTFILHQANTSLKLPSDLAGLTTARYQWPRSDDNHRAAVASACDEIRRRVHANLTIAEASRDDVRVLLDGAEVQSLAAPVLGSITSRS